MQKRVFQSEQLRDDDPDLAFDEMGGHISHKHMAFPKNSCRGKEYISIHKMRWLELTSHKTQGEQKVKMSYRNLSCNIRCSLVRRIATYVSVNISDMPLLVVLASKVQITILAFVLLLG